MTSCKWIKKTVYKTPAGSRRYELTCKNRFSIDVSEDRQQGYPGSNMVRVFRNNYGGWILNTPRSFSNKSLTKKFIEQSKKKLEKGEFGKEVPFPE